MADATIWTNNGVAGTNSYPTGGFSVVTSLSSIAAFSVEVNVPGANLGQVVFDVSISGATATIKVMQQMFDRQTTIGSVIGLPSGITLQTTNNQSYNTNTHTHSFNHDHPVTAASTAPAGKTNNIQALAAQPNVTTHTHTVDFGAFTGTSGAETAHDHTWNNIYQHQHSLTNTQTDLALAELANATDLSGTTFNFFASDG